MRIAPRIPILLALLAASAVPAAEQPAEPEYSFRTEGHVRLRSGPIDVSWESIPFNRTYSELTQEQKARFKTLYVGMPESDEPPYPAGGLKALYEPIGQGQAALRASGVVEMEIVVGADGEPAEVLVMRSPSSAVTKFVGSVAMLTKFKPAICSGQPCRGSFPLRVQLRMR